MRKAPNTILTTPVMYLIFIFKEENFFDVIMYGKLTSPPTMPIPIIDPIPNNIIYVIPTINDSIVDNIKSIKLALPAIPCIRPTANDL